MGEGNEILGPYQEEDTLGPSALLERGPVSMQGAGQADLSSSLLGSLDSSRIPEEAIAQLIGQGPTFGQRMGQALAGGVAAMRGQPNPVTPILESQQKERVALATMLQRMNAQVDLNVHRKSLVDLAKEKLLDARQQRAYSRDKAAFDALMGIVKDPNASPSVLAVAQPQVGLLAKKLYGVDLPASIIERRATDEQKNTVLRDLYRQMPPELILKNNPWLSPDDLPKYAGMLQNPGVLESLNLKTADQLKADEVDRMLKENTLLESMMPPGFQRNASNAALMHAKAEALFPGVPILELSKKDLGDVTAAVREDILQEAFNKKKAEQDLKTEQFVFQQGVLQGNREALLDAKRTVAADKPPNWNQVLSKLEPMDEMANGIRSLQMLRRQAEKMPEEAFPKGKDFLSRWAAKQYREKFLGGDEGVYDLQMQAMNVFNGVIGRRFYDDKGNRLGAAIKPELEGLENLPPKKTFLKHLETMQTEFRKKMSEQLKTWEASGIAPDELIAGARSALRRVTPKAKDAKAHPGSDPLKLSVVKRVKDLNTGDVLEIRMAPGAQLPPHYLLLD